MEIKEREIYSLKRVIEERRQNRCISQIFRGKVKLNFALDEDKFFSKLVEAYSKILSPIFASEDKFAQIKGLIETDNIKINFNEVSKSSVVYEDFISILYKYNYTKATRPQKKDSLKETVNAYHVTIKDIEKDKEINFLSTFDVPICKKLRDKTISVYFTRKYHVFDIKSIISEFLISKECHEYIHTCNEEFIYSAVKEIIRRGISSRSKYEFEKRFFSVVNTELLEKYYIENLDLPTTRFVAEEFYKSMYLLTAIEDKYPNLYKNFEDMFTVEWFIANDTKSYSKRYNHCQVSARTKTLCKLVFKEMSKDNDQIELYEEAESENEKTYARSYEDKKNIPSKVIAAMQTSKFLKHFTYVEYDEMTDLTEIRSIENEFDRVANYLGLKYMPNTRNYRNIRFRRLGKYKSSGIYFNKFNCVCVDLDSPDSLCHELIHMIDSTTIKGVALSSLFEFRLIADKYTELLDNYMESLPDKSPIKAKYYSKNKFNRDYYTYYPEIFAYCGEIYLRRILKIDSNLVDQCTSFIYPKNETLDKMIKSFYENIVFNKRGYVAPADKVSYPTNENSQEIIELKMCANGQFSLF